MARLGKIGRHYSDNLLMSVDSPVLFVAVDGLRGDNIIELPDKTKAGLREMHQPEKTLIECLDMVFGDEQPTLP